MGFRITSRRNRRLKDIRRLRRSKGDHALLEGPHLVEEALAAGVSLEWVLVTPEFLETSAARRLLPHLPVPPWEVATDILEDLTDADSPRGILAVGRLPRKGIEGLPRVEGGTYLYADRIQDPGNLGALARVAEAVGATALALGPGTAHPNHPRALRGSAGSLLRLPVALGVRPEEVDGHLAAIHPRWVALVPRDGQDLYTTPLQGTLVLAVGSEGQGLSPQVLERIHLSLTIPLEPPVESLNATVAAAVVLFELRRRRRQEGIAPPG